MRSVYLKPHPTLTESVPNRYLIVT